MNAPSTQLPVRAADARPASTRDEFIDLCRAVSLLVVVLWHWVFTIVVWHSRGPSADSPLSFTRNLWILTWVLQVMPVFFFVGGYAHMQLWSKLRGSGVSFVVGRMRRLLVPSLTLLAVWAAIAAVAEGVFHAYWFGRAALLIVSPLWFIAVYLALVLLAPLAIQLHQRFGPLVVVILAGLAALVDVLRFGQHAAWAALINLLVVWALCHQLGFFYRTLVDGDRILAWCFVWSGLLGLVLTKIHPPSMVGVPGDQISNMGPPTLCIVALCFFQTGLVLLVRPWILERLRRPGWAQANEVVNRFALPLFLFHITGYAIAFALLWLTGYRPPSHPTLAWWAQRPIWLLVPLVCTIPVILVFGRRIGGPRRPVVPPPQPPSPARAAGDAPGTVALSRKAWMEPSKVEALPRRRHQKALEPLDRAPDRLRLSARVEAIGRGNRSMQQHHLTSVEPVQLAMLFME